MKFEEWVKGIENAAIKGLCSTHPNICKMIYNEGQKDIEKALKDKGVCLQSEYDELKQKVEGYERTRNRLVEIGFPTFMSCREYAEKIEKLEEDLKHKKIAIQTRKTRIKDLEKEKCELLGIIQGKDTAIQDLQKKNKILTKALNLYINWADECGIGWDNFPDMSEKWSKTVEEKGLGWIEGLTFMVMEEAKEQLRK